MKQQYQKLVIKDNCHPFKIVLLAIIQMPVWICFSVSLRNLTFNPSFVSSGMSKFFKLYCIMYFLKIVNVTTQAISTGELLLHYIFKSSFKIWLPLNRKILVFKPTVSI